LSLSKGPVVERAQRDDSGYAGDRVSRSRQAGPRFASFVAPHHDRIPGAIADLVSFIDRDDLSVVVQVAVALAQFETIHPFADGNGRTGRALAHSILRGKGLVGLHRGSNLRGSARRHAGILRRARRLPRRRCRSHRALVRPGQPYRGGHRIHARRRTGRPAR
ncbi:MAG: Fic family protein, partial [Actinobacteria bacterium]|nr:Fic family protein [Actinomycetota bacterium]